MRNAAFIFYFFLMTVAPAVAQVFTARQTALGGIKTTTTSPIAAGNPAAGGRWEGFSVYFAHHNLFTGSGISRLATGGKYAMGRAGSFQINFRRTGLESFHHQLLTADYAHPLGDKIALGAGILFFSRRAAGYEPARHLSFRMGLQLAVSSSVQAGILVWNPIPDRTKAPARRFDSGMAAGIAWQLPALTTFLEIEQPQNTPFEIRWGADYRPSSQISILLGAATAQRTGRLSLGAQYHLAKATITATTVLHNRLPVSYSAGLSYRLIKKQESSGQPSAGRLTSGRNIRRPE